MTVLIANAPTRRRTVYMDANATERPRPEAVEAMLPYFAEQFGNPSATFNQRGRDALAGVEAARFDIAQALGGDANALVFTSGATEANNMVFASFPGGVVTTAIEHKCVLESARQACPEAGALRIALPDDAGIVHARVIENLIGPDTRLVSVMMANNEIGTLQPIAEIGRICDERGVPFHCDATQAVGKVEIDVAELSVDYLTLSSHKVGGPPGIGALLCSPRGLEGLKPLLLGGGQEQGYRPGTTPTALCVGFAKAVALATANIPAERIRLAALRNRLLAGLAGLGRFELNGDHSRRLANNLNGGFVGTNAVRLLRSIPELQCSTSSACTTGAAPSHVLRAIGLNDEEIAASFRLGLSWATTAEDIDTALNLFEEALSLAQQ